MPGKNPLSFLAGCASWDGLEPTGHPIEAGALQADRSLRRAALDAATRPTTDWWRGLADPQLDRLIEEALAGTAFRSEAEVIGGRGGLEGIWPLRIIFCPDTVTNPFADAGIIVREGDAVWTAFCRSNLIFGVPEWRLFLLLLLLQVCCDKASLRGSLRSLPASAPSWS